MTHQLRAESASERWSIQLGAFRVETAAEQAARSAANLPVARGKPLQIVQPSKAGKDRLYRARLLNFTLQEAQGACAALHKNRIECSVVPPTVKVAARYRICGETRRGPRLTGVTRRRAGVPPALPRSRPAIELTPIGCLDRARR